MMEPPVRSLIALLLLVSCQIFASAPAFASSDDAWAEFHQEVEDTCRALVQGEVDTVDVNVVPFGSESYGAAVVTVTASWGTERSVCIFDKASRKAELTGPLAE